MSHRRMSHVRWITLAGCLGALFLLGFVATEVNASEIHWLDDLQAARQQSVESGRPMLLHFWAPWCAPCKQMEHTTFLDPNVVRLLSDHYIPVKLNVDHPNSKQVAAQYGLRGVPADLVIAPGGQVLAQSPGKLDAQKYTMMLTQVIGQMQEERMVRRPQMPAPPTASPITSNQPTFTPGSTQPSDYPPYMGLAPSQPAQPAVAQQQPVVQQGPYGATLPSNPAFAAQPPVQQQAPAQPQPQQQPQPQPSQVAAAPVQQPTPTYGLEGYCPVELTMNEKWVPGNLQYGAVHQGVTYLFAGPEQQKQFLADPNRFAPVNQGFDVVLNAETGQKVPGKRQHGVFLINGSQNQRQIYLFASETTLKKFQDQMAANNRQAAAQMNAQPQQPPQSQPAPSEQQAKKEKKPWWYR